MWLDKHRVFRRLTLLWSVWLITATCHAYFEHIGEVNAADATVIVGVIGILTVVIGFQKDDAGPTK